MTQSFPARHARKYHKKLTPAFEVEAALLTDDNASEISNWAGGAQIVEEEHALTHTRTEGLNVVTADGKKRASVGQYVVKDSAGNFYVVNPGVFEAQYTETL